MSFELFAALVAGAPIILLACVLMCRVAKMGGFGSMRSTRGAREPQVPPPPWMAEQGFDAKAEQFARK